LKQSNRLARSGNQKARCANSTRTRAATPAFHRRAARRNGLPHFRNAHFRPHLLRTGFEEVKSLQTAEETAPPDQFNELGVRKYDLPGLFNRMRRLFRRPTTSNPRLVAYLAAGAFKVCARCAMKSASPVTVYCICRFVVFAAARHYLGYFRTIE